VHNPQTLSLPPLSPQLTHLHRVIVLSTYKAKLAEDRVVPIPLFCFVNYLCLPLAPCPAPFKYPQTTPNSCFCPHPSWGATFRIQRFPPSPLRPPPNTSPFRKVSAEIITLQLPYPPPCYGTFTRLSLPLPPFTGVGFLIPPFPPKCLFRVTPKVVFLAQLLSTY